MAVRMVVFMKFEEWADELSLGEKTPRQAFESIRKLMSFKGVEYARVVVSVDGAVLTDAAFRVENRFEIYDKFAGWHREES